MADSALRSAEARPGQPPRRRAKPPPRQRNPALTKQDILVAARAEFCEFGLDGARVDRIAERAAANKRLLYHYFGNKEALYSAVLLEAYREIREGERELHLEALAPAEAMRKLVGFTFDHFRRHPWFIRLLATENIQRAEFVKTNPRDQGAAFADRRADPHRARRRTEGDASSGAASTRSTSTSRSPASAISTSPTSIRCR